MLNTPLPSALALCSTLSEIYYVMLLILPPAFRSRRLESCPFLYSTCTGVSKLWLGMTRSGDCCFGMFKRRSMSFMRVSRSSCFAHLSNAYLIL